MDVRDDYISNLYQLYIAVHSCGDNSYFDSSLLIYYTSVTWPHARSNAPKFNRLYLRHF